MSGTPFGIGETATAFAGMSSASDTADKQLQAAMYAANIQKQMHDEDVSRYQPFYQQGVNSLEDYAKMLKGGYNMKESPAAQYELQQGTKAMNRQLAGRGMLGGGTAANRLTELSSGVAARDWQNSYSRLLDSLKLGTGAASSMGQSGANYGNQAGNTANSLGQIYGNQGNNTQSIYQNFSNQMSNMGAGVGSYFARNTGMGGSSGSGYEPVVNETTGMGW
jgi:hypothetical protein